MTTQRLPFQVPDERAHLFVDSYADMHNLVEDLVVPADVPEAAATVLHAARELLRQSYYCYEFSTVAVMHSLIAVEIVLRESFPWQGVRHDMEVWSVLAPDWRARRAHTGSV